MGYVLGTEQPYVRTEGNFILGSFCHDVRFFAKLLVEVNRLNGLKMPLENFSMEVCQRDVLEKGGRIVGV